MGKRLHGEKKDTGTTKKSTINDWLLSVDLVAKETNTTWREVFKLNVFSFYNKIKFISHKNKLATSNIKKTARAK